MNLRKRNCLTDDLEEEYETLIERGAENNISETDILQNLKQEIQLDPNREQRRQLEDITIIQQQDLAIDTYPELSQQLSANLWQVDRQTQHIKHGVSYEDHHLLYPRILWNHSNLTNFLLEKWKGQFDLSLRLRVDQLGLSDTTFGAEELERWQGPESLTAVRESFRPDEYVRYGDSESSYACGLQDRTDFYFQNRDDEYIIEIEELLPRLGSTFPKPARIDGNCYQYWTRYLHAVTDPELIQCKHIDGAIRIYHDKQSFIQRHIDSNWALCSDEVKSTTKHRKLFLLDSDSFDIPDYHTIIGLFFKWNPHVIEFFEGDSDRVRELEEQRRGLFSVELNSF